jgi:integrase/recombinase XerD
MSAVSHPNPLMPAVAPQNIAVQTALLPPFVIAETNQDLIALWLHGKSPNTCDGYRRDIRLFLNSINQKPLQAVTLNDIQAFAQQLAVRGYAAETQRRRLTALKSLLTYGYEMEILARNLGKWIKLPKVKVTIAERILSEAQVMLILAHTDKPRDYALLRLLYATGCRVSELCALRWRDVQASVQGRGQVTFFGKGQRTRNVVFSAATWQLVSTLRGAASANDFVFQSRTGKKLYRSQVARILRTACEGAGIVAKVSPHWFRHSHASHALERGTPINLVQTTLGHASIATTGIYLHVRPQASSALYLAV